MMNIFVLRQSIILFLAALIWGFAFVAQSVGMDYVEPYTFIVGRNIVALFVLVPCIAVMDKCNRKKGEKEKITKNDKKRLAIGGICCGACLFAASAFQQIGIKETSVGKAGFITAMYMVFVPILGIFLKKKTGLKIWIAVVLALVGMYLLCLTRGRSLYFGQCSDICHSNFGDRPFYPVSRWREAFLCTDINQCCAWNDYDVFV